MEILSVAEDAGGGIESGTCPEHLRGMEGFTPLPRLAIALQHPWVPLQEKRDLRQGC